MNTAQDQNNPEENIDLRMRTLRTVWLALCTSIFLYYVLTIFTGRNENATPNNTLSLTILLVAFSATLISFVIKNKLVTRAIDQQQVQTVQQAYVVTWAISEVGALLGLLDFFVTGNRYYYAPFLIAGATQLLHYPRREHVENAAFKRTTF
jgi:magnesium-transporting ATPase (P-type)